MTRCDSCVGNRSATHPFSYNTLQWAFRYLGWSNSWHDRIERLSSPADDAPIGKKKLRSRLCTSLVPEKLDEHFMKSEWWCAQEARATDDRFSDYIFDTFLCLHSRRLTDELCRQYVTPWTTRNWNMLRPNCSDLFLTWLSFLVCPGHLRVQVITDHWWVHTEKDR